MLGTDSLLLKIQEAVSCRYLSDLHTANFIIGIQERQAILGISDSLYTIKEWNEALSYIFNEPYEFDTIAEAKQKLIEHK